MEETHGKVPGSWEKIRNGISEAADEDLGKKPNPRKTLDD